MGVVAYSNNFAAALNGALPAGFTQLVGTTWQTVSSLLVHGAKSFSPVLSGSPVNANAVAISGMSALTDMECCYPLKVRMSLTGSPSNQTSGTGYSSVDPFLRASTVANTGYDVGLATCGTFGGVTGEVRLTRYVAGASTSIGSAFVLPSNYWRTGVLTDGDLIWVKVKITGSSTVTVSWKSWLDGNVEPSTYATTFTDSSGTITSGVAGFYSNASGSTQFQPVAGDVSVMDLTSTALGCPPISLISRGTTTATVTTSGASGGIGPYTGQYWRSTTNGSVGSAIAGATPLAWADTGLTTNTTYYYTYIVTDSTPTTPLTYSTPQLAVTTTGAAGSIAVNQATLYKTTTANEEVVLTGTTTTWAANTTFQVNGVPANLVSQVVISATTAYIYVTGGLTGGNFTVGDGINTSPNINVSTGTVVAPNDPGIHYIGAINVGAQESVTISSAPAFTFGFTGDSVRIRFNVGPITVYPRIYYRVDNGPLVLTDLSVANPFVTVSPTYTSATAVKALNHNCEVWYQIFEGVGSGQPTINQWVNQLGAARLAGIDLPGTGTIVTLGPPNPNVLICVGDSITASVHTLYTGTTGDQTVMLVPECWTVQTANALGLALIMRGYGGTGLTVSGSGGVPAANTAYSSCYSGVPYTPAILPMLGIIYHGTNDGAASSATFQAAYVTLINTMRAQSPSMIIMCVNPHSIGGVNSRFTDIQAAIVTAGASTYAFAYDAHTITSLTNASNNLENGGTGVHLSPGGNSVLAVYMITNAQTLLNSLGIKSQTSGTTIFCSEG